MKKVLAYTIGVLCMFWAGGCKTPGPRAVKSSSEKIITTSVLRHVVLFKFKEDVPPEQIKKMEDAFRALPEKIDSIIDFEWGTNVGTSGKDEGFTHCFFVSFLGKKALDEGYIPHKAHQKFIADHLADKLDKVLVMDYFAAE